MTTYPQSEKLSEVAEQRALLDDFLDWLDNKDVVVGTPYGNHMHDFVHVVGGSGRDNLLFEFLGIDPKALEAERRAMLKALQEAQS